MSDMINDIRHLSSREFFALGVQNIAYVKEVVEDGVTAFAIHAADGSRLGLAKTRDLAIAALKQHDLEPLSVH
ncbi:MAG TPA: DUF1150 family protein [Alphaproteobacteria bacterium]|nr:DUF1150 family protein [Alphaproteobacteria bacterium]